MSLENRTVFITGGSRGIGRAIALKCAADGANIIIAAKTDTPHPTLPGTIHTVAQEIEAAGGRCLPLRMDARDEKQIHNAIASAAEKFGGVDIVINNASAINLTGTLQTPMSRFDLMMSVNVRATFATCQAALPYLLKAENPHILTLSPPLNMDADWFKNHVAYTMSKYGMSMCMLGMAEEFRDQGVACNTLWPVTAIATDAFKAIAPNIPMDNMRKPEIVADAAYAIFNRPSRDCTGNFFTDEQVLKENGVTDFSSYAMKEGAKLIPDFFL